jgi:hypothetical protein
MNSFYITLKSDASNNVYTKNNAADFKNILPKAMDVSDNWEVALIQIIFPKTFHNVVERKCYVWFYEGADIKRKYHLSTGTYMNVDKILSYIQYYSNGSFSFSIKEGRVFCQAMKQAVGLKFSEVLSLMLGFSLQRGREDGNTHAFLAPNINLGIPSQFRVLSNVVSQQIVGDQFLPMLSEVVVDQNNYIYGSTSLVRYATPIYLPVAVNKLDTASIYLTDSNDSPCSFDLGTTTVLLHFRRCEEK